MTNPEKISKPEPCYLQLQSVEELQKIIRAISANESVHLTLNLILTGTNNTFNVQVGTSQSDINIESPTTYPASRYQH